MTGNPVARDDNHVPVLCAQDSTDPTKLLPIQVNPATGAILVEAVV